MKEKWIEDLREGLSDFEMDAPEGLWESLGVETHMPVRSWRRKISVAAAILTLLTVGSIFILWLSRGESLDVSDTRVADYRPLQENTGSEPLHTIPIVTGSSPATATKAVRKITPPSVLRNNEEISIISVTEEENTTLSTDTVSHEAKQEPHENDIRNFRSYDNGKGKSLYAEQSPKKGLYGNRSGRYAIAAYAAGFGQAMENMGQMPGPIVGDDPFWSNGDTNAPPPYGEPDAIPVTTETHHHQPVKAGLTFQYRLNDRIGLETGLIYTALATDITVSQGNNASSGSRRMQYLGIPLNVKLSVWSWKSIDIYMSAGVTGEKCVSNRFRTKFETKDLSLEQYSSKKEKPMQWSVNAAPGLQIKPLPHIGIFAEPGVSYYFNDGSSISTIYKDRPWNFNLNLGLRIILNP